MNGRQFLLGISGHPLAQILAMIVMGVVLAAAVLMGAFVILALVGFFAVAFGAFAVRAWWRSRGRAKQPPDAGNGPGASKRVRYIEGEYEVIESDADAARRRSESR